MKSEMVERVAKAIYDAPTTFDGDQIAEHLGTSMAIDGAASSPEDLQRLVMGVCRDAAIAALKAMREPTEGMLNAGHDAWFCASDDFELPITGAVYDAMLGAEIAKAEEGQ